MPNRALSFESHSILKAVFFFEVLRKNGAILSFVKSEKRRKIAWPALKWA
jgi:hypothetical protein